MPHSDPDKNLLLELADEERWDELISNLPGHHPADLAEVISTVPSSFRKLLFERINEELKPDVLAELEGRAEEEIVDSLTNAELSDIAEEMSPDDAADLIGELPEDRSEQVLQLMEKEESEDVRELLKYDEESAGGIMTTDVFALPETYTVSDVMNHIAGKEYDEPFYNAYIVDEQNVLCGYVQLWDLLTKTDRSTPLRDLADRDIISATTNMDQEEVAKMMSKYDLTSIPVVDQDGHLVGRITVDDVIDVLEEEASEDIFLLAGSDDAELTFTSPLQACMARLPWLLITLVTGFVTSLLLKEFMTTLSEVLALTFFVPIVMAMGGNTGIQSSTLMVRGLALGTIKQGSMLKLLLREIVTGAIMGLFCGIIIALWVEFLIERGAPGDQPYSSLFLAITVGLALFSAMTFAALYGAFVPVLLNRMNVDPAVASGPFVTSSNDISALLIYYAVTILLISQFAGSTGSPI